MFPTISNVPWDRLFLPNQVENQDETNPLAKEINKNQGMILIACITNIAHQVFSDPLFGTLSITSTVTLITVFVKDWLSDYSFMSFLNEKAHEIHQIFAPLPLLLITACMISCIVWPMSYAFFTLAFIAGIYSGLIYSTELTRAIFHVRLERDNATTF